MSWLRIDDEFEEHEKVEALSDAAHRLWFRCGTWCRKRENQQTNGAVPERVVVRFCGGSLAKARKLADELVQAKGEAIYGHEHGLWEPVEGGWRFHDWEDYQPPTSEDDERKHALSKRRSEAGRLGGKRSAEARLEANGTAQPKQTRSNPEPNASKPNRSRPEALASKQTKQPRSPDPDPDPEELDPRSTTTTSPQPPTPVESQSLEPEPESTAKVPCPSDLRLRDDQVATLETMMVPKWAIEELTRRFVLKAMSDPSDTRSVACWRKCLVSAVHGDWGNAAKRPKKPEPHEPTPAEVEARNAKLEAEREVVRQRHQAAILARAKANGVELPPYPPKGQAQRQAILALVSGGGRRT